MNLLIMNKWRAVFEPKGIAAYQSDNRYIHRSRQAIVCYTKTIILFEGSAIGNRSQRAF